MRSDGDRFFGVVSPDYGQTSNILLLLQKATDMLAGEQPILAGRHVPAPPSVSAKGKFERQQRFTKVCQHPSSLTILKRFGVDSRCSVDDGKHYWRDELRSSLERSFCFYWFAFTCSYAVLTIQPKALLISECGDASACVLPPDRVSLWHQE